MGRFTSYPAATALYAANIGLTAVTAFVLMAALPDPVRDEHWVDRKVSLVILLVACAATIALSFVEPRQALWAMALNLVSGPVTRAWQRRIAGAP